MHGPPLLLQKRHHPKGAAGGTHSENVPSDEGTGLALHPTDGGARRFGRRELGWGSRAAGGTGCLEHKGENSGACEQNLRGKLLFLPDMPW